jgi:geranylgeranyl pyrophosphate synthase
MTMTDPAQHETLGDLLAAGAPHVDADLDRWLVEPGVPQTLADGMRYCTRGGKRLRPGLVGLAAEACGGSVDAEPVRRAAVAVEMIHAYSLVHDDLPAMDDDDLRRGQPTAHVKFGEAMAILIGDALLTRALGLLAETPAPTAGRLAAELATGAGPAGMVGGQVADMDLCELPPGQEALQYTHSRKTGALLRAAARMGAVAAEASPADLAAVTGYAERIGLAFQVVDDVLDATGTAEQLGKTPGKDAATGKRTYVTELGQDAADALSDRLTREALDALQPLGARAARLAALARQLCQRTH